MERGNGHSPRLSRSTTTIASAANHPAASPLVRTCSTLVASSSYGGSAITTSKAPPGGADINARPASAQDGNPLGIELRDVGFDGSDRSKCTIHRQHPRCAAAPRLQRDRPGTGPQVANGYLTPGPTFGGQSRLDAGEHGFAHSIRGGPGTGGGNRQPTSARGTRDDACHVLSKNSACSLSSAAIAARSAGCSPNDGSCDSSDSASARASMITSASCTTRSRRNEDRTPDCDPPSTSPSRLISRSRLANSNPSRVAATASSRSLAGDPLGAELTNRHTPGKEPRPIRPRN